VNAALPPQPDGRLADFSGTARIREIDLPIALVTDRAMEAWYHPSIA
jgi:hypothetical protein